MAKSGIDRRKYKRHPITCSLTVLDPLGEALVKAKTANLSDGGVFFTLDDGDLIDLNGNLMLRLALPRKTLNTFMLEQVSCAAKVVRYQKPQQGLIGIALEFIPPQDLGLEV